MFIDKKDLDLFTKDSPITITAEYKGEWFDFCPVEGTSEYQTDKYCHSHVRVVDRGEYYLTFSKPNFNNPEFPNFQSHEDDVLIVRKINKSDIPMLVNEFNQSRCVWKISRLDLDEEMIWWIGKDTIYKGRVDSYEECDKLVEGFLN